MEDYTECSSPWIHTIKLLDSDSTFESDGPAPEAIHRIAARNAGAPNGTRVTVTGRPSSKTIMVMWCNSTVGHYGAQTWYMTTTYEAGLCELSGHVISRGDAVYRPRYADPAPANEKSMILARFVMCEELEIEA